MHALRSTLFAVVMALVTVPYGVVAILCAPLPPRVRHRIITSWAPVMMALIPPILGIRFRVIGQENIPDRPSVIVSKHQSAWETIALQVIFPPLCYVLKRELLRLPFFGWGLAQIPSIAIDRASGKEALGQVLAQGCDRLREGFWVVVFPEGTRVAPGTRRRFKPGGACLAAEAGVPLVPVAHNAGSFWPRNAFIKRPGEITVSIGPPIDPAGKTGEILNAESQAWIEAEMRRLFPADYSEPTTQAPR